jgi:hypothetical protein
MTFTHLLVSFSNFSCSFFLCSSMCKRCENLLLIPVGLYASFTNLIVNLQKKKKVFKNDTQHVSLP